MKSLLSQGWGSQEVRNKKLRLSWEAEALQVAWGENWLIVVTKEGKDRSPTLLRTLCNAE